MDISAKIDFIKSTLSRPIVLVGLMGAGKTSLGAGLGHVLELPFIDSDAVIVEEQGCSIADIFAQKGEPEFRTLERQTIKNLMESAGLSVIGTGGGAFMNAETRQTIKKNSISVFLKAELEVLLERVGNGEARPLFKDKKPSEVLSELIKQRYPVYQEADLTVETLHEPEEETLNRLISTLYTSLKP